MDPPKLEIGNVFQWRDTSNFAWGPWKFKWWEPRTLNKKSLSKALGIILEGVTSEHMLQISSWALLMKLPSGQWRSQNTCDNKPESILVQIMAWCHQTTSHCLSQCWPRSNTKSDTKVGLKTYCYCCCHLQVLYLPVVKLAGRWQHLVMLKGKNDQHHKFCYNIPTHICHSKVVYDFEYFQALPFGLFEFEVIN